MGPDADDWKKAAALVQQAWGLQELLFAPRTDMTYNNLCMFEALLEYEHRIQTLSSIIQRYTSSKCAKCKLLVRFYEL